jgi:hypothetical protein
MTLVGRGHADGSLAEACESVGLTVVNVHSPRWSTEFRRQWRSEFGMPEADWRRAKFEWELLGSELAPARPRRSAIREFNRRRDEARRSYVTRSIDYREVLEVEGLLPEHAWWRAAARSEDLYIVHGGWLWSFVLTHEEEIGIGPFFVESVTSSSLPRANP